MLKAAIAGVGFMGWIHYLAYQRSTHATLHAFCSRDPKKQAGDWTDIRGNFGPPGGHIDLNGLKVYQTLEQIVEDPEVDLVDICLPPHLHADAACLALQAGKHVLCEKPLGLSTEDCDRILSMAAKASRPGVGRSSTAVHGAIPIRLPSRSRRDLWKTAAALQTRDFTSQLDS